MNWVDLACLGLIILGALSGLTRGFTRECVGLFGWVVAAGLANRWYPNLAPKLTNYINPPNIANIVSFLAIFFIACIVINALANAIVGQSSARFSLLGRLDRLLGLICGGLKSYAGLTILYLIGGIIFPSTTQWPDPLQESQFIPYVYKGAVYLNNLLPNSMQRDVVVPQLKTPRTPLPDIDSLSPAGISSSQPANNRKYNDSNTVDIPASSDSSDSSGASATNQ